MTARVEVDPALVSCSVRYALGRHSYLPGLVADEVRRTWPKLGEQRTVIREDIARWLEQMGTSDYVMGAGWSTPPGFTWGHACRLLFEQAQAEGHLVGWSLGFNDDTDSGGQAWPVSPEITATVNDTLLAFLRQSNARGFCDFAARPGERVLDAWRWRERGDFWTGPAEPPVWADGQLTQASGSQRR